MHMHMEYQSILLHDLGSVEWTHRKQEGNLLYQRQVKRRIHVDGIAGENEWRCDYDMSSTSPTPAAQQQAHYSSPPEAQ